jgi:uncharacterized radical SAM superfamily Fe-S cluster-containing enzyme
LESVCPVCLRRIPAETVKESGKVFMKKSCPDHGMFKTLVWNGPPDYESWAREHQPAELYRAHTGNERGCPFDCGICPDHKQNTCCVLLEVTSRCGLQCPVCFASSGGESGADPDLNEISAWFDLLMESGGPFNIQLSGGEPTMRDDLPRIIKLGREKGFDFFQLNTNGLRLAKEPGYADELKTAGLDCVFLQFDGLDDDTYIKLRGRPLLDEKLNAMGRCAEAGLGVVLVPTVVPGVNDRAIGAILDFAVSRLPDVRGVHFQPISYFGRYPGAPVSGIGRVTIPDMLKLIETQTEGRMRVSDFKPGGAESSYCSFSGSFLLAADGKLSVLGKKTCCCGSAKKSREYVARRWRGSERGASPDSPFEDSLDRIKRYTLAVSAMFFQDAWNLDLDRLKYCYIHVLSPDRRLIPFCAYNLTDSGGNALYRGTCL